MYSYMRILLLSVVALPALQTSAFLAESQIGNATAVKNNVHGVVEGKEHPILEGTELYANEMVYTGHESIANLKFIDRTILTVGPVSEIRLDKFVFDPASSAGAVVIQATRGAFRFITGSQGKEIRINTPYGTLGVRG
jgi:hypothetical protein